MPSISDLETFHVALPTRREHKWAGLTEAIGGYILVKLSDDSGYAGWGEAPVLKDWGGDHGRYFGESPGTTLTVIDAYLRKAVLGAEVGDFAGLHARMDKAVKGYPYAKAAIDIAAYDLAGRAFDVSAALLLGGWARREVPVTHSIGLIGFEEAEKEVAAVAEQGVRTIKIKVGVDPIRDVEMVRRIRETVGPKTILCVDANQGYVSPREAIRVVRRIEKYDILYVEQPVEGIDRLAEVARAIDIPVMADESAWNARDAFEIAERRAAEIVSIYTTKPGGLYRASQVAAVCQAAGIRCNVNGSVETGIGNRANVIFAAATPVVSLSCVVPVSTPASSLKPGQMAGIYYKDDLITEPFVMQNGAIMVPDAPGLGWDVDLDKIRRYDAIAKT
ncbi:MAG: mandelate racemase/muconate lactonizing enzyme family protein [Hyphomicrobiaceae bacterium]